MLDTEAFQRTIQAVKFITTSIQINKKQQLTE